MKNREKTGFSSRAKHIHGASMRKMKMKNREKPGFSPRAKHIQGATIRKINEAYKK